jgi:hypothetical protein
VKKVCVDCQASTKFIAQMVGRVISVSDANQFHNFEDFSLVSLVVYLESYTFVKVLMCYARN